MTEKKDKRPPLEQGLDAVLRSIDNQINRDLQRTPKQVESEGVSKDEPIQRRIELIASLLVESVGHDTHSLEACLTLAHGCIKASYILVDELGHKGLGSVRARIAEKVLGSISEDALKGTACLRQEREVM